MLSEFFFWAGLSAVGAFFASATLLATGFFTPQERSRRRLAWAQSGVAVLLAAFTVLCAGMLRERLAPWSADPPPASATAVVSAMRETMSVMLLGLSCTVTALLTAITWVRLGSAGAAFRAVVWAFPAVRLVTAASAILDFFGEQRAPEAIPAPEEICAAWRLVLGEAERGLQFSVAAAGALFLLSWPLGWWIGRLGAPAQAGPGAT